MTDEHKRALGLLLDQEEIDFAEAEHSVEDHIRLATYLKQKIRFLAGYRTNEKVTDYVSSGGWGGDKWITWKGPFGAMEAVLVYRRLTNKSLGFSLHRILEEERQGKNTIHFKVI